MGAVGFVGVVSVARCGGCCRVWWVLQGVVGIAGIIHRNKKKFFFFFYPHTCSHTYPHTSGRKIYCQGFYLQNLTKVPEKYSYLVPTVQHRYTNSIAMLHYQYSYAGLSV